MNPEDIEQKLQRAIRLHRQRRLDEAEVIYREVLRAAPGNTEALHMCGLVAHQRGRHREAASLIELAIAADPSDPLKHNNCGEAYRALGLQTMDEVSAGWDGAGGIAGMFQHLSSADSKSSQSIAAAD